MKLSIEDIMRLSRETAHLTKKADWLLKGKPVVVYEFADMRDFMAARYQLSDAISHLAYLAAPSVEREMAGDRVEIDACGVTFRLICKQRVMTPRGPYGAAEVEQEMR